MKRISSLILAMVSTMFLFAGATRAAEKFDHLSDKALPALAGNEGEFAALPCIPCEYDESAQKVD